MSHVVCVGIMVRDIIFEVDALPGGGDKVRARNRHEIGGGPAANAAAAIATLGGSARLLSVVGSDAVGIGLVDEIALMGVDISGIKTVDGLPTPLSAIAVEQSGERLIINHPSRDLLARASLPSPEDFKGADAVLVDVQWVKAAVIALSWARQEGLPGVVDLDIGNDSPGELIELASHVVFSEQALARLTGEAEAASGLRKVAAMSDAWLGVTIGAAGSLWLEDGEIRSRASFDVDVVDTTGAGDVYHGAFALSLAEGRSEAEAIELSTAAAALSCRAVGGRQGVPDRRELMTFLKEKT